MNLSFSDSPRLRSATLAVLALLVFHALAGNPPPLADPFAPAKAGAGKPAEDYTQLFPDPSSRPSTGETAAPVPPWRKHPWTGAEITLHTTVYQVQERLVRQSLLTTAPQNDATLLTLLAKLATEDQATVLLDQESSSLSGQKTQFRAITEFIYPTEHDPHPQPPQLRPVAFETKFVGSGHESQSSVYGPADSPVIEVAFQPQVVDLKKLDGWPAAEFDHPSPDGPRTEARQPLFLSQSVNSTLYLRPGQTRLAGMSGNADVWEEENPATPRQVVLTFLTATLRGGEPPAPPAAPAPPVDELRAHVIGLRLPARLVAAALWARETLGDSAADTALLEEWLADSTPGGGVFYHSALALHLGQKSVTRGIAEYIHPSEWDSPGAGRLFAPTSFETMNIGTELEIEPDGPSSGGALALDTRASLFPAPVLEHIPWHPTRPDLDFLQPAFISHGCRTTLTLRPGESRLLAAATTTPGVTQKDEGRWAEVFFLRLLGTLDRAASPGSLPEEDEVTTAAVISVSQGEADAIRTAQADPDKAADIIPELREAVATGQCRLEGFATVTVPAGGAGVVETKRATIYNYEAPPVALSGDSQMYVPRGFGTRDSSTSLTVTGKAGGNGSSFSHDSAPAIRPTAAETQARLKKETDAGALTRFFSKNCDLPADWPRTGPVPPCILSLAPAVVPPGHPEHGRWHVIIARRTAQ